jgi:hypothetical protein
MAKLTNLSDGETWDCKMDAHVDGSAIGFIVAPQGDDPIAELTIENSLDIEAFFAEVRDLEVKYLRGKATKVE